jgi:hypothetical protein
VEGTHLWLVEFRDSLVRLSVRLCRVDPGEGVEYLGEHQNALEAIESNGKDNKA